MVFKEIWKEMAYIAYLSGFFLPLQIGHEFCTLNPGFKESTNAMESEFLTLSSYQETYLVSS